MWMLRNKRGLSLVVSYVLLIVLAMSVSIWVYSWLKGNVNLITAEECPEDVVLQISNISYESSNQQINFTVSNKGLFNVDGFVIRAGTDKGINFGDYVLNSTGLALNVSKEVFVVQNASRYYDPNLQILTYSLTLIEVQPYILGESGKKVFCKQISTESNLNEF